MKLPTFNLIAILIFTSLTACAPRMQAPKPAPAFEGWKYSDVRLLVAPQSTKNLDGPIAFYYRENGPSREIRLDFMQLPNAADLYITLKTLPGPVGNLNHGGAFSFLGNADWDHILVLKAGQPPQAYQSSGKISPSLLQKVSLDAALASMVMDLDPRQVASPLSSAAIQVFSTHSGSTQVLSQSPIAHLNAIPPARAPLLLAFWDTLPAATPAQVLRRWDGAHTGPLGLRHGLAHLVENAASNHIPLFLLDLKTPQSLSALDDLGQLNRIRTLESKNLLILPDPAYGDPASSQVSLGFSRAAALSFGFAKSGIAFAPAASNYDTVFADLTDQHHLQEWSGQRYIPLPASVYPADSSTNLSVDQVDEHGLTENTKLALLKIAVSSDPSDLLVLGGSLPASPWGDTSVAPTVFRQLAAAPWIQLLDEGSLSGLSTTALKALPAGCRDLLCTPAQTVVIPYNSQGKPFPGSVHSDAIKAAIRQTLDQMPASGLKDAAWQTYLQLSVPTVDAQRTALLANYVPEVGLWLRALSWANHPQATLDCSKDVDWDGLPECILANENTFLELKPDGGRLVLAIARTQNGYIPWISPASQLAIGLSDPLDWQIDRGPGSDPQEIAGAFVDRANPYQIKQVITGQNEITFKVPGGLAQKKFSLTDHGLAVQISSSQPENTSIPITILDPDRYQPDGYQNFKISQDAAHFKLVKQNGQSLDVTVSGGGITTIAFNDSFPWMRQPEDPNRTYPAGHYLPVPLILLNLKPLTNSIVTFAIQ